MLVYATDGGGIRWKGKRYQSSLVLGVLRKKGRSQSKIYRMAGGEEQYLTAGKQSRKEDNMDVFLEYLVCCGIMIGMMILGSLVTLIAYILIDATRDWPKGRK